MKDKMKGLIVGLTIGTMLTGSVALASGTQIEVAFRNLKYMFDGVEKAPTDQKSFIYDGSTYVPIRFISEALGKPVEWDEANETIWIGNNPTRLVASYEGGQVTSGQFDTYLAIQKFLDSSVANYEKNPDYLNEMIKQLIRNQLLTAQASAEDQATAKQQALALYERWKSQGEENLNASLAQAKLTQDDVISFLTTSYLLEKVLLSHVSDDAVKAEYEANLAADKSIYTKASVRHILISLTDEATGKPRSKDEALKITKEVQVKLKNKGDFTALAKQYSEDPGSKDNGGLYADAPVNQWVPEFKKAAIELAIGTLSEPVESSFGYHLIQVDSRSVQTLDQVKGQIQSQLVQEYLQNFTKNELPGLITKIQLEQP
ncbi:Foldase protein PrsA 3 precursor [compost metagenome]